MTIAYLYYDLLNLYGENGNIKILDKILKENKIDHKILYLSLEDELDFSKYDLVYIGSGTEDNLDIALKHLLPYKDEIKKAVQKGKFFLVTGNALDMFGLSIINQKGRIIDALATFDYSITIGKRVMEEIYKNSYVTKSKIIGFYNHSGSMTSLLNPLFEGEGIHHKNFYGTYVLGPILVRNPEFLQYFLHKLLPNIKLKFNLKVEKKAYNTFIENYCKEAKNEQYSGSNN